MKTFDGEGIVVELADCRLIIKNPCEIGTELSMMATIGIKFNVGDRQFGSYRAYTSYSTLEDVAKDIVDMLNEKNDVLRHELNNAVSG